MMASTSAGMDAPYATAGTATGWVVFGCDGRVFGFPLERVREILLPRPFTRLPGCGPEVHGLIGLRGRVVTVFDLGATLGLRPSAGQPGPRLLLIECAGRLVGGVVEDVTTVQSVPVEPLGRRRSMLGGLRVERDAVLGFGRIDGEPFLALDSDRILGELLI